MSTLDSIITMYFLATLVIFLSKIKILFFGKSLTLEESESIMFRYIKFQRIKKQLDKHH